MEDSYHRDRIANRQLHPETLMMGYGYAPGLSEGSLKPPIFLTSTFVFENAQQGKDFFDLTSGRRRRARARIGPCLFALQQPEPRNSRRPSGDLGSGRAFRRLRGGNGGDFNHAIRLSPGRRHHTAQSTSLWRHRNAAPEADGSVWGHRIRLCRRH